MGFHICEYCTNVNRKSEFSNMSSGDVTLTFDSGRSWMMPDMILHYVADHNWQPPGDFVNDVMKHQLVGSQRLQTKSVSIPTRIGYLIGPFNTGFVPKRFVRRLQSLMADADRLGNRTQYRGI
jgi:hypothetical protein